MNEIRIKKDDGIGVKKTQMQMKRRGRGVPFSSVQGHAHFLELSPFEQVSTFRGMMHFVRPRENHGYMGNLRRIGRSAVIDERKAV